jgi:hypothetical protein
MSNQQDFNDRIARMTKRRRPEASETPQARGRRFAAEKILEFISDIVIFGWWAFFSSLAFCVFAAIAFLHFLGFEVEFFLGAAFVIMLAVALAWHMWEG